MTDGLNGNGALDAVLDDEMRGWQQKGLERQPRAGWQRHGVEVQTANGPALDFSSNDYLGLATDSRLIAAAERTLATEGVGATASRLIAGTHSEHEALERDLAAFFGAPGAILFNNGFTANVGTIPALVGEEDVVFSDAFNHASLIDGCRLSRAKVFVYEHSNMNALRSLLSTHRGAARRALIMSDGLFSMDGDLARVPELISLAREFNAWSYIDDAHAVGVVGHRGRGSAESLGVHGAVDITMGTLGKAFGAAGAFVYGSSSLCRHLLNRARSFVYSTAMLPAQAAAAREALRIVGAEPERRMRLRANAMNVRKALRAHDANVGGDEESHIIPLVVGDATETMRIGAALRADGVLVGAVRPPTVAHGGSRLRISVSSAHEAAHVSALANAYARARHSS